MTQDDYQEELTTRPQEITRLIRRVKRLERMVRLLEHGLHGMLVWTLIWWTFVLAQPNDTFATSASYRHFLSIASEEHWTVALGAVAALGLAGMIWRKLRLIAAWSMAFCHALIAGLLAAGPVIGTGIGVYAGIATTAFFFLWLEQSRLNREVTGK